MLFVLLSSVVILSYYVHSNLFGPLSVLGFLYPILFLVHLVFTFFWWFRRSAWILLSLSILIVSLYSFGAFYRLGSKSGGQEQDLSILTYNAKGFNRYGWIDVPDAGDKISTFINENDPDIACIQEHTRIRYRQLKKFKFRAETPYHSPRSTQAIFSKYPIISKGSLDFEGTSNNVIYADVALTTDTLRVYNVHLQSFNIVPSEDNLKKEEPERLFNRIGFTLQQQLQQVKILRDHMGKSPYRSIVCGDFNSTQFSNVYKIASEGLQDTFMEKGSGLGATYNLKSYPLRIDYILVPNSVRVLSHTNFNVPYSDHFPVMATLGLRADK